jgi:hypothetical protein
MFCYDPSRLGAGQITSLSVLEDQMNAHSTLGLALGAALLLVCGSQRALGQITITLDERGTPGPYPSTIAPDPLIPGGPPTVAYALPFGVVPGDLVIQEPPITTAPVDSDLLRWVQVVPGQQSLLLVYSDVTTTDPANAPADVGIPLQLQTNLAIVPETGLPVAPVYTDAANGVVYTPTAGMPGFIAGAAPFTYSFISDIPEPGIFCLTPALAGLLRRRR